MSARRSIREQRLHDEVARSKAARKAGQLTREDLRAMSAPEILKARAEGRLDILLGVPGGNDAA